MLLFGLAALSFKPADAQTASQKPKLVVGIVVDQMRFDYLTRFEAQFGDRGFKRLMSDGFECRNNHFYVLHIFRKHHVPYPLCFFSHLPIFFQIILQALYVLF